MSRELIEQVQQLTRRVVELESRANEIDEHTGNFPVHWATAPPATASFGLCVIRDPITQGATFVQGYLVSVVNPDALAGLVFVEDDDFRLGDELVDLYPEPGVAVRHYEPYAWAGNPEDIQLARNLLWWRKIPTAAGERRIVELTRKFAVEPQPSIVPGNCEIIA